MVGCVALEGAVTTDTRDTLLDALRVEEGTGPMRHGRFMPYTDSVGVLTIGYGCAIGITGLTREEAEYLLDSRVRMAQRDLDFMLPWWVNLDDARQFVLCQMAYQLGLNKLLDFRKFREALRVGDYSRAADEMLDSRWATQTPARAMRLAAIMRKGVL